MTTSAGPIAAVNAHSGDPHYEPSADRSATILLGDWLLIDAWAKQREPEDAVYADITWVAVIGRPPSDREQEIFHIVRDARDAAIEFLQAELSAGRPVTGAAVDGVARRVIAASGYGDRFIHRLGHSIGTETHSNGVNLDGFETNDTRTIMPGSAFSIEPGIYLPDFGVRLEANALAHESGVEVTTELQQEIVLIELRSRDVDLGALCFLNYFDPGRERILHLVHVRHHQYLVERAGNRVDRLDHTLTTGRVLRAEPLVDD